MAYNSVYAFSSLLLQNVRICSKHHWITFKIRCIMKAGTKIESQGCCHTQQMPNTFFNLCNIHLMPKT